MYHKVLLELSLCTEPTHMSNGKQPSRGLCFMVSFQEEGDWEVTADGLYIATRKFLIRRGYCCANRCRNCPYINWRDDPTWRPIPAESVRRTRVSPKAVAGAKAHLSTHERQLTHCSLRSDQEYHSTMTRHYHWLLERWGANR